MIKNNFIFLIVATCASRAVFLSGHCWYNFLERYSISCGRRSGFFKAILPWHTQIMIQMKRTFIGLLIHDSALNSNCRWALFHFFYSAVNSSELFWQHSCLTAMLLALCLSISPRSLIECSWATGMWKKLHFWVATSLLSISCFWNIPLKSASTLRVTRKIFKGAGLGERQKNVNFCNI